MDSATNLRPLLKEGRAVMRGRFEDHSIVSVMHALSICRQLTAAELYDRDRHVVGWVYLKSGMVIDIDYPGCPLSGLAAFHQLMKQQLDSYCVFRLPPAVSYPQPIGRLSTQILANLQTTGADEREPVARTHTGPIEAAPRPVTFPMASAQVPTVMSEPTTEPTRSAHPPARPVSTPRLRRPSSVPVPPHAPSPRLARRGSTAPPSPRPASLSASAPVRQSTPVVAVASPKGGCGKTTIALNLAVSLARSGLETVLVDVDPNGDVLSYIAARDQIKAGCYEAVMNGRDSASLLLRTMLPELRLLPALGPSFAVETLGNPPSSRAWARLFANLGETADLVVVDTAAGLFGNTCSVLEACTHVIGVLQAEAIPKRSFTMFERGLSAMPAAPEVLGVVLNMFQRNQASSIGVLTDAITDLPETWLFDTTIPRTDAFLESSEVGLPLRSMRSDAVPTVTWLFDMLAGEVRNRLSVEPDQRSSPVSFLV